MSSTDLAARFSLDVGSLENLKRTARNEPDKALRTVATQFEALFMQMMLKSMRDSVDSGGLFDSNDTKLYTSMLDQQLSGALAKRGIGLADVMVRQLSRAGAQPGAEGEVGQPAAEAGAAPAPGTMPAQPTPSAPPSATEAPGARAPVSEAARSFVARTWPHAVEAGKQTGIAPHFIVGQAALESGWGRSEIRMPDGSTSHNLFGVKAGRNWKGPVAEVTTTEYVNGSPVKTVERFRAYTSYAEAFRDYGNLLASQPRYAQVLGERTDAAAFARGLQQAGYATDPAYADKLTRVINGSVLRAGLAG